MFLDLHSTPSLGILLVAIISFSITACGGNGERNYNAHLGVIGRRNFGIDEARAGVEEDHALAGGDPAGGAEAANGGQEGRAFGADPETGPR